MVTDTLIVDTKRVLAPHKSSNPLSITVEGQESIFWITEGKRTTPGTTTKLILRKAENPWDKLSEQDFIQSVENVIPNPPFKINIKTLSHDKVRDEKSFQEYTAFSIKDHTWRDNDYIRTFEISISKQGIVGSAIIAILENHNKPVIEIELNSRNIEIEGETYSLERSISLSENSISESSKSITINDEGEINDSNSYSEFSRSKSRLSLHGIEIPSTLFPESWRRKNNQVKIAWPFPLVLVIDIGGSNDLDLNSPRTEIIMSEKWIDFEEKLAFLICNEIAKQVTPEYWDELKIILISKTKNELFIRAINKVVVKNNEIL